MDLEKDVWLVEIKLRESRTLRQLPSRTMTYEEVLATDWGSAIRAGFEQFEKRCQYEPVTRRKLKLSGFQVGDFYASEAVELD